MKKLFLLLLLPLLSLQAHVFFPPDLLESNLKSYSQEEKAAILKDLSVVRSVCFPENPESKEHPQYLATAGAPGSRKTTILENFLSTHPDLSSCIYLDPDPRSLKYMVHTYISRSLSPKTIAEAPNYDIVIQNAYNKWRYGSTYIASTLLEEALQNRFDVAYGTTSTGEVVPHLLKAIREAGYEITLLLCSAEDEFRFNAVRYRNQEQRFYQSSPEDAIAKGKLFPQRMTTYFTLADNLYFYWSDDLATPAQLAATYLKGELLIHDREAWEKFSSKHERDRAALSIEGKTIPSWQELLKLLSFR